MLTLAVCLASQAPLLGPVYWMNDGGRCTARAGPLTAPSSSCTVRGGLAGGKTIGAVDLVCDGVVSRHFASRVACAASAGGPVPAGERSELEALRGCLDGAGLGSTDEPLDASDAVLADIDHVATLCACTAPGTAGLGRNPSAPDVVNVAVTCLRRMGAEPTPAEIAAMEAHAHSQMPGLTSYEMGRLAAKVLIYGGGGLMAVFFLWRSKRSAKKASP